MRPKGNICVFSTVCGTESLPSEAWPLLRIKEDLHESGGAGMVGVPSMGLSYAHGWMDFGQVKEKETIVR